MAYPGGQTVVEITSGVAMTEPLVAGLLDTDEVAEAAVDVTDGVGAQRDRAPTRSSQEESEPGGAAVQSTPLCVYVSDVYVVTLENAKHELEMSALQEYAVQFGVVQQESWQSRSVRTPMVVKRTAPPPREE